MRTFLTVWFGQLISIVGSGLTQFGLALWIFGETRSVTSLATVVLAASLPAIIVGPFAGSVVDRFDRRMVMIAADTVTGISAAVMAALFLTDTIQFWQILVMVGISSIANAFQEPAWLASVPLLVPKEQLSRANGMTHANQALGFVMTPVLAGILIATIGIGGILLIDFVTFVVAVVALLIVRIPRPETPGERDQPESLWADTADGLRYLRRRTGLLLFMVLAALLNFLLGFTNILLFPLLLSFTSETVAGTVLSVIGVAMLLGSIVASSWKGPTRRIRFVLATIATGGVFLATVGWRESAMWIAVWMGAMLLLVPLINTTSQTLWQLKVALDYQGRVFATRRVAATIAMPVSYLLAGPLADGVFEPLLAEGGGLAGSVGQIIGTGPGRGIGLMYIVMGIGIVVTSLSGFLIRPLRNIETDLPDVIPDDSVAAD